jgi:2-dehydro-3-deoxy-D-gluconate 5-dehydrogenase
MKYNALFDLSGKVALVTGANTGLGQAIAVGLAAAGADIVAAGRSDPAETSAAVVAAGQRCSFVRTDFGARPDCGKLLDAASTAFGAIDIVVNNAGTIRRAPALEFSERDWDEVMDVNLRSVFLLSQAAARLWTAGKRGGKIINIASMLSFQGGVRVASYTASKSGVAGITRLLANEWAALGINVNAIAPGYFATNNTAALRVDTARNREILGRIPAGCWGEPRDLAGAAVFLASAAADYVHGAILPVDGGWLVR